MHYLIAPYYPQVTLSAYSHCFPIENLAGQIKPLNTKTADYQQVNYPFCLQVASNHWTLVYINRTMRTIEYYDSKVKYGGNEHQQIIKELKRIGNVLSQETPGEPFTLQLKITKCLQPDSYQCGIWVLYFLENILKNPGVDFNHLVNPSQVIAEFRIEVMHRLIQLDELEKQAETKELSVYTAFYKDADIGRKKYLTELRKLHHLVRKAQLLQGQLLQVPREL